MSQPISLLVLIGVRRRLLVATLGTGTAVSVLGGQVAPTIAQTSTPNDRCSARPAQFAVGQPYTHALAHRARRVSGASLVRRLAPGEAITLEYLGHRLTLEVGRRNTVTSVRCD
jgi:hypothetical protein